MRKNRTANHGIAFEEDVALRGEFLKSVEIEGLEVAADVEHSVATITAKSFDLLGRAEVVVDAVAFSGARFAAIVEDERLQAREEARVEFCESLGKRTFPGTRGAGENDQAT
jgi:hypothetical protein